MPNFMYQLMNRSTFPLLIVVSLPLLALAQAAQSFTEPYRTVDVSVDEPGVLDEIAVEPGELVEEGQRLFSLDTSVLEANLAMARQKAAATGAWEAAVAELQHRKERIVPLQRLRERGQASPRELEDAKLEVEIAEARLKLAEEDRLLNKLDCQRIEAQIARRRVDSPFRGYIAEVHREEGESFLTTEPRVLTLVQIDKLRIRFGLMPHQLSEFQAHRKVNVTITDGTTSHRSIIGQIERISPVIDPRSGTLEVSVVIDNSDLALRSGIRCELQSAVKGEGHNLASTKPVSTRP